MELTKEQKEAVAGWVAEGLKLSDIQSSISESFGITMTYMDLRFLVDDLNLVLKDQPKPVDADLRNAPPQEPEPVAEQLESEPAEEPDESGISVSLHRLYKPGSVVSGEVTFSDGVSAEWSLDQIGRLTLNSGTEGYQPSEPDVQEFQKKLSMLLQNQGY